MAGLEWTKFWGNEDRSETPIRCQLGGVVDLVDSQLLPKSEPGTVTLVLESDYVIVI